MSQIKLLKKIKKYFSYHNINPEDQNYYLTSFSISPGYLKLKELQNKSLGFFYKIKVYLLSLISSMRLINCKLFYKKIKKDYNAIILTWGKINNFSKNGSFQDNYFNQSSDNNKNFLWFIISLDGKKPKKLKKNIVLFLHNNLNIFNFFLIFFKFCKIIFINLINSYNKNSFYYLEFLSLQIWEKLKQFVHIDKLRKVIIPYEAQPFQNFVFNNIKKINKNISTIGYAHSNQPFPTHLYKRKGAPDILYVHGADPKYHCERYLGWKNKDIKLCPSFRFVKKEKDKFKNTIFLPYDFHDEQFIIKKFFQLIKNNSSIFSSNLKIKIHPHKQFVRKHVRLKLKLKKLLINNFGNQNLKIEPITIVIGGSSILLEALENKISPYHIFEDEITNISSNLWPNIFVKKISNNCYQYSIKKFNSCIKFNKKKMNLNFFK